MGTTVGKRAWQAVKDLPLLMIIVCEQFTGACVVPCRNSYYVSHYNIHVAFVRSQTVQ